MFCISDLLLISYLLLIKLLNVKINKLIHLAIYYNIAILLLVYTCIQVYCMQNIIYVLLLKMCYYVLLQNCIQSHSRYTSQMSKLFYFLEKIQLNLKERFARVNVDISVINVPSN